MGNKLTFPAEKRIVVVGAGYGGSQLGRKLMSEKANFMVIDSRDAMHHNMAAVRAVAIPGFVAKTLIPFRPTFGDHFKQGKVIGIFPPEKKVKLESGEEITYDDLVIATGTTGPFPVKLPINLSMKEASAKYDEICQKVKDSKSMVVIGGGAAGVELACEVAAAYPDKEMTLVHAYNELVAYPKVTKEFQDKLVENMKGLKINLLLGEKVKNLASIAPEGAPGSVETESGKKVTADLVLNATGLRINKEAYEKSLGDKMEKHGALKVNEFLQIEGHDDIYAIGDCNNTKENKLAFGAEAQADLLANNLKKKYAAQQMVAYKPGSLPVAMVLALSAELGMAQMAGGRMLPQFLASKMKAKDVFVGSMWKKFKQPPPQ